MKHKKLNEGKEDQEEKDELDPEEKDELDQEDQDEQNQEDKEQETDELEMDDEESEPESIVAAFASGDQEKARELIKRRAMDKVVDMVREL